MLHFDRMICGRLMRLWPLGIIRLVRAARRKLITRLSFYFVASLFLLSCFCGSGSDKRNEEWGQKRARAGWERARTDDLYVSPCMPVWTAAPLCVSACHQVKQPEVWSNFLLVMEVITALAHCSDWSLLVTMGCCDFVWGRVSGNQVGFRREDVFNQAHSSFTLQVMRLNFMSSSMYECWCQSQTHSVCCTVCVDETFMHACMQICMHTCKYHTGISTNLLLLT